MLQWMTTGYPSSCLHRKPKCNLTECVAEGYWSRICVRGQNLVADVCFWFTGWVKMEISFGSTPSETFLTAHCEGALWKLSTGVDTLPFDVVGWRWWETVRGLLMQNNKKSRVLQHFFLSFHFFTCGLCTLLPSVQIQNTCSVRWYDTWASAESGNYCFLYSVTFTFQSHGMPTKAINCISASKTWHVSL